MRTFSNSVLAGLIATALFWGNCFSCPQFLLSFAQTAPHGCCKRSTPVTRTCTTGALKHFVKAETVSVATPVAAPAEQAFTPATDAVDHVGAPALFHSPPNLLESSSPLRI